MLKFFTIAIILLITNLSTTFSQPWHYDFGTSTGVFNNNDTSITFLPSAPSGIAKVRVGSGGGKFVLDNTTFPFSNESYLRISAPIAGSVNKFVVYDYIPGNSMTLKFKIRFGDSTGGASATSGIWNLFVGDGTSFKDNISFTGAHVFMGLEFTFGASGTIATRYRTGSTWTTITGAPFQQGVNYIVEIYCNNDAVTKDYEYSSTQSVGAYKYDIWVDGILICNDLIKGQLINGANIDSWMFYGVSSAGNAANIFLDEFDYHNDVAGTPLPVTLTSFNITGTQRSAKLTWSTSTEINNAGFEIERSSITTAGIITWTKTAFISGNGTTNEPKSYIYEDKNLTSGKYSYRLKQIDFNGNYEYFNPSGNPIIDITKPIDFTMGQNYPNPSNPVSKIDYNLPFNGFVNITVYDITGKAVKQLVNTDLSADYHSVSFDGSDLSTGVYFYRITVNSGKGTYSRSMKLILAK